MFELTLLLLSLLTLTNWVYTLLPMRLFSLATLLFRILRNLPIFITPSSSSPSPPSSSSSSSSSLSYHPSTSNSPSSLCATRRFALRIRLSCLVKLLLRGRKSEGFMRRRNSRPLVSSASVSLGGSGGFQRVWTLVVVGGMVWFNGWELGC